MIYEEREVFTDGTRPEHIVFVKEVYGENLWNVVAAQIEILTGAEYQCVVWTDEYCIVIEYAPKNLKLGGPQLKWVNEFEVENE